MNENWINVEPNLKYDCCCCGGSIGLKKSKILKLILFKKKDGEWLNSFFIGNKKKKLIK